MPLALTLRWHAGVPDAEIRAVLRDGALAGREADPRSTLRIEERIAHESRARVAALQCFPLAEIAGAVAPRRCRSSRVAARCRVRQRLLPPGARCSRLPRFSPGRWPPPFLLCPR